MGFKYLDRVYAEVKGTSPSAQAVLAYLAHRTDDKTGRCFPKRATISEATHLGLTAISNALTELREKRYLSWIPGGRQKTGRSLANSYTIVFPREIITGDDSSSRQTVTAGAATRSLQEPPGGHCTSRQAATITHGSKIDQKDYHPPVGGDDLRQIEEMAALGEEVLSRPETEDESIKRRTEQSVLLAAVIACKNDDIETRKILSHAMIGKDPERCLDTIHQFESELRQGEMRGIRSLPRLLTSRLAALPSKV